MTLSYVADSDYSKLEDDDTILRVRELRIFDGDDGLDNYFTTGGIKTNQGMFDSEVNAGQKLTIGGRQITY